MSKRIVEIRPQAGPQTEALASPADLLIMGGHAGCGKTVFLILESLRHHRNPKFGGVIFRRTGPELTGVGSIWEECKGIYPDLGAHMVGNPNLMVRFPSGAIMQFLHLENEDDAKKHKSKQYSLICFDEAADFTEVQFFYMLSRLRTGADGINPVMRGTCNPDPDSFLRIFMAWWIGLPDCEECQTGKCRDVQHGYPNPDRSGVIRWFTRVSDVIYWRDTEEEINAFIEEQGLEVGEDAAAMSFTFIEAKLEDNPALLEKDPGYKSRMLLLTEVEKERLGKGNWNIRATAGSYISAKCFRRRWVAPLPPLKIYMASDYAVTEQGDGNDPDSTEHGVFGMDPDDNILVLDWWHGFETPDVWIEAFLDLVAKWKPLKAFGEVGVIRRAIEAPLRRRMRERRVYCSMKWLSGPQGERSPTNQGYKDRSKRAKAIKGRSFQARASMDPSKFLFPANAEWASRVIQSVVGFPMVRYDDPFDTCALVCMGIDQMYAAQRSKKTTRKRRDAYAFDPDGGDGWKTA